LHEGKLIKKVNSKYLKEQIAAINCFSLKAQGESIKKGKLLTSHRYDHLPLLPSGPGGFSRSWSYKTCLSKDKENGDVRIMNLYWAVAPAWIQKLGPPERSIIPNPGSYFDFSHNRAVSVICIKLKLLLAILTGYLPLSVLSV
jgi:hypothetical protein